MMLDKHKFLSAVEIFSDLTPTEVEAIGNSAPMTEVPTNSIFCTPGYQQEVLYILKKGRVQLYQLTPEGRKLTMAILEEGTVFGEMNLLGQTLENNYAESITPCVICQMSRDDVNRLLLSDTRIATRILASVGKRVIELEGRVLELAYKKAPARVAAQLIRMSGPEQDWLLNEKRREVRCTHEELAALVGVHRETATKILNGFRTEQIVDLKRGKVIVLDVEKLERLSANT